MMRTAILLISVAFYAIISSAQQLTGSSALLKNLEQADSLTGARVVTINHVMMDVVNPDTMVDGYRIRIFFDNSQYARQELEVQRELFDSLYPELKNYVEYSAPYFKLTVGNFVNYEEAMLKWSSIVKDFQSAFIVPQNINVREFKTQILIDTLSLDSLLLDSLGLDSLQIVDTLQITDISYE